MSYKKGDIVVVKFPFLVKGPKGATCTCYM